jgi:transcriptional regulator with XRE-family HTH domain
VEIARFRKQQVLQQAVTLLGKEKVAASLKVSINLLESWIRGDGSVPDGKLLALAAELVRFAEPKK